MIFSMRTVQKVTAVIAFLTAGVANSSTYGAEIIGDPWWDAVLPAEAEAEPPIEAKLPGQGQKRIDAQRRQAAMNVLRRELSLVRQACPSLSADERSAILGAVRKTIDEAKGSDQGVIVQDRVQGPAGALQVELQARDQVPDTQGLVRGAVAKAVAKFASAEEIEAYEREIAARASRRRAAALAILVDAIDHTAMLDTSKRDELAAALEKNWQPFWEQAALHIGQAPARVTQFPPGVAAVAADVLGPEAFQVWQSRLRREIGS